MVQEQLDIDKSSAACSLVNQEELVKQKGELLAHRRKWCEINEQMENLQA